MGAPKHFLDLNYLDSKVLRNILDDAASTKKARNAVGQISADSDAPLNGRLLAMIFEKPSTRTRVSFHIAMRQLGGETINLVGRDTQLGRGETAADTARVLSRYVDAIMVRTNNHGDLAEMSEAANVPVINGLTDLTHPCQVMADILTIEEKIGSINEKKLAWCGSGNNMANSWIQAAARFGFELKIACPNELLPDSNIVDWALGKGARLVINSDIDEVLNEADVVMTDTWVSMNDQDGDRLRKLLKPYQVNEERMKMARDRAIFLHCLPAHRGEEVTEEVIDGPQSCVWDEAENRIHAQKSILKWCLSD